MKIIICDDRKQDRSALKKLLVEYKQTHHHDLEIVEYEDISKQSKEEKQRLDFSFVEGRVSLQPEDIIYIETSRHKNFFYTKTQVYSIYRKLSDLEIELKDYGFVRIHLSFLVNMRYIEKISSYILLLTNGKEISVPKSRYAYVKETYAAFKKVTDETIRDRGEEK